MTSRVDLSTITTEEKQKFVDGLAEGLSVIDAAGTTGRARQSFYRLREGDPEFASAWKTAYAEGTDLLEKEAERRALEGVSRRSYDKDGNLIREEQVYSDTLMIFMLKARRPNKFRDRVAIDGGDGPPVKVEVELGDSARDVLRGLVDAGVVQPGRAAASDATR